MNNVMNPSVCFYCSTPRDFTKDPYEEQNGILLSRFGEQCWICQNCLEPAWNDDHDDEEIYGQNPFKENIDD